MTVFLLPESVRQQIKKTIEYARQNVYSLDDVLDMKNKQKPAPGEDPEHVVFLEFGRTVCYYQVQHPEFGLTHYFSFSEERLHRMPTKEEVAYVMKEFGLETGMLEKYLTRDEPNLLVNVRVPDSQTGHAIR